LERDRLSPLRPWLRRFRELLDFERREACKLPPWILLQIGLEGVRILRILDRVPESDLDRVVIAARGLLVRRASKVELARNGRTRDPRLLRSPRALLDCQPSLIEHREHVEPWLADGTRERSGVGAMAVSAVQCDIARLRCVSDQRPLRCLHLSEPAASGAQAPPSERIIAAGIQNEEV